MDAILKDHVFSSLLNILDLLILLLCISMEFYIFYNQWKPAYHLLPSSLIILYQTLRRHLRLFSSGDVFLIDFSCFRPQATCRVTNAAFLEHLHLVDILNEESKAFMAKVLVGLGYCDETYLPHPLQYIPPVLSHGNGTDEALMVLCSILNDLFTKTSTSPRDIDLLVVNCSIFSPSPSLASIVVNRFAMRDDVKTYSVSGMGCSAGAIGVDIARSYLRQHRDSYAVVLSTEILSVAWYAGKDRRKLLLNCSFRMGGAAILLTNRTGDKERSKYKLVQLVRAHRGSDDKGYHSAILEEDSEGITGVTITRDLLKTSAETLRENVEAIAFSILPLREKLSYLWKVIAGVSSGPPDFSSAIQHYCLPSTAKPVILEIGKGLGLQKGDMEAATMTVHRFGNQSSATVWYQLAYLEAKEAVADGDRVWQISLGSGRKGASMVWQCLRPMTGEAARGPWFDSISRYPVEYCYEASQ